VNRPDTTGRAVLTGSAYRDEQHLRARQSLYRWQHPRHDLPGIVLDHLPGGVGALVDIGCGNGTYLARIRAHRPDLTAVGLDVSAGILADVPAPIVLGEAAALPFAGGSATAVLAMHMLYHVADIPSALAEVVRVLRPDGVFIASTNARDDKAELDELWSAAAAEVLGTDRGPRRISLSDRFPLDDTPAALHEHFADVRVLELPGTITVHEPDPVIAHLASYRAWADSTGVPFDDTLARARHLLTTALARDGAFRITCRGGIVLGRAPT
jgi:SAM-dependent methyltransferase